MKKKDHRKTKRRYSLPDLRDPIEEAVRKGEQEKTGEKILIQTITALNRGKGKTAEAEKIEEKQNRPDIYYRL